MTAQYSDPWEQVKLNALDTKEVYDNKPNKDAWDEVEFKESTGKSIIRTLYQIPSGIAQAVSYPLDLIHQIGMSEALDPLEIDRLREISEREGIPFDEEKYREAAEYSQKYFPTQGNIERAIEEQTGAPLTPKTDLQKGIKFASTAGKLAPKDSTLRGLNVGLPKPVIGAGVSGTNELLKQTGLPEPLSELASFGVIKQLPQGSPKLNIGKEKKPSGLITRRYESIKNPTEVSKSRFNKINEKVESDFRIISKDLIKESPVEKTYNSLKEDVSFKNSVEDKFSQVEKLSEAIPGTFSSNEIKKSIAEMYQKKESKGITPSEYDLDYNKFMKKFLSETPKKDLTASNLVTQYRKNNGSLRELYEPAQSKAYNRAKKDALLDYNKIIAEKIETQYPESEFSKLFKETNKKWTEIKDSELIDSFIDDLFEGKVNFKEGKRFSDKNYQEPFKRALGDNFPKFEMLMNDLMSTQEASALLKVAGEKGYSDLVQTGIGYLIHPKLAATKVGYQFVKDVYRMLLDKPKLTITWDQGVKALKKGDYAQAEKKLMQVENALNPKKEAVKKYNEKKLAKEN